MAYEELFDNPERVKKAVMLYEGNDAIADDDVFYHQKRPYETLNLLMMVGTKGEEVRICKELRNPNGLYIRRWEKTLEVMTDIFTAQCAYTCHKAGQRLRMPKRTERGDRGVNFEMMQQLGGTFAYTSTSLEHANRNYVAGKIEPHLLTIRPEPGARVAAVIPYLDYADFLGDDYSHPNQREILLPPMVRTSSRFCGQKSWAGINGVSFYEVQLTGFGMELEIEDEQKLLDYLEKNATQAAKGLDDMVSRRKDSVVLGNPRHPYWHWKRAFRQLVLQRMQKIYESYYGKK